LLLSNEIITETIQVLRYPRLQKRLALTDEELYDYAQFLRQVSQTVILSEPYHARLRDADDLHVLQTAERGAADMLCTNDKDSTMIRPFLGIAPPAGSRCATKTTC
jgi:putative PIN family toxin of toxin-antitoxin system